MGVWLCAIALLVPWLLAAGYLVTQPEEVLATNLLVDDSLYFAVPARNFWAGHGLSFDGIERTNGVQTLWMLVTLGLFGLIDDPLLQLRSLVATSALFWLLSAFGIHRLLRARSPGAALLAAVGFAWAGVHDRLAFLGMENGATALVSVMVLLAGNRVVRAGWSGRSCLLLGSAIALFALNRTEGVLLGPIAALPLVLGWLGADAPVRQRLRSLALLATPGVLLIGSALLVQRACFDTWLPISGTVKSFYEEQWASRPVHDGVLANVLWHLRYISILALAPLREDLPALLSDLPGTKVRLWRNLVWAMLALAAMRAIWIAVRGRVVTERVPFLPVYVAYAVLHFLLIGLMLPHFTNYGTWYFATEAVAIWMLVGFAFSSLSGRLARLPYVLVALVTVAGPFAVRGITEQVTTGRLRNGGIWLHENVPAGTVVGTLSSGLAAWYASDLHVVNLDGLINNKRYFDDFLSKGKVAEYFDDRGIEWFADYKAVRGWRQGITWNGRIPAERLVPRQYSRMPGDEAYAVWRVLPKQQSFELLGSFDGVTRDRYVELGVAADVHGRFPVVRDDELAAALAEHEETIVARSIVEDPKCELLHVLATPAQLEQVALTRSTVHPEHVIEREVVPGLRLVGFDDVVATVGGRRRIAVTLYWSAAAEIAPRSLAVHAVPVDKAPTPHTIGTCRETLPMTQWHRYGIVTETVVLAVGDGDRYELVFRDEQADRVVLQLPAQFLSGR